MPQDIMCPGRQCAPADNVPRRQFAPGDDMPRRQCAPEGKPSQRKYALERLFPGDNVLTACASYLL